MTVIELLDRLGAPVSAPIPAREVTDVTYDSRRIVPGAVFVALRGQQADGAAFAGQALDRGAIAIIAETPPPADVGAPWFVVPDARRALAVLSSAFFGAPSHELLVVGITGTNGKTTTSYLLCSVFDRAGMPCGRIGTVSYRVAGEERPAPHTTPEASDLQRLLREMVQRGCGACAMEVSSHALAQRRVDETRFAAAVFTNLTRDHLDFHRDMEDYFEAKRRLFEMLPAGAASVVNLDDPRGASLLERASGPVTYAIDRAADVRPGPLTFSLDGLKFDVRTPRGLIHISSRLVGRPNVYNILAAVATAVALDVPFSAIEQGIATLENVPGRFQVVSNPGDDVTVVVDYAHTDDALRNLLETARPLARGRIITVFGCGGDRDRSKRPLMGAVAARLSDVVVVTSDNPRSEDPMRIIDEIARGMPATPRGRNGSPAHGAAPAVLTIVDRAAAIERTVREAVPGDLVLIAGKGHERYQVIGSRTLPFDDVEVARAALGRRRTNSHVM